MIRAFTVDASRESLWPWVIQLGKQRAGWYLLQSVERFVPRARRAARSLDPARQGLVVGAVIPDYGGLHETFEVAVNSAPSTLVYRSVRGRMSVSWSINLAEAAPTARPGPTRVHLRLRLGHVRRPWLTEAGGDLIDLLTVAGLAALAELSVRLRDGARSAIMAPCLACKSRTSQSTPTQCCVNEPRRLINHCRSTYEPS